MRALAARLGTDPATTVRIVQGLGFETYKDFQRHLHDVSVAYALDTMKAAEREGMGPAALVRAALHRDLQNLHALSNSLDGNKICALAKRLHEASKILLLGGDAATSLVDHLEYHLTVIGLPVWSATTAGRVSHVVRNVGRKDLVIGIIIASGADFARRLKVSRPPSATALSRLPLRILLFHLWRVPQTLVRGFLRWL